MDFQAFEFENQQTGERLACVHQRDAATALGLSVKELALRGAAFDWIEMPDGVRYYSIVSLQRVLNRQGVSVGRVELPS